LLYYLGLLGKHGRDGLPGLIGEKGKVFNDLIYSQFYNQPKLLL